MAAWLAWGAACAEAQSGTGAAPVPSATPTLDPFATATADPNGSYGPEVARLILKRVKSVLAERGLRTGSPAGYHWIFLVQTADYPAMRDVRFSNRREGMEILLTSIVNSRKDWRKGTAQDTIDVLPFHFNVLDKVRPREQSGIENFLTDAGLGQLIGSIPTKYHSDVYMNARYRDGHDWRRALMQTIQQLQAQNWERNSIIVVLDWNSLSQAPIVREDGKQVAKNESQIIKPEDPAYVKVLREARYNPKQQLLGEQVGRFMHYVGVFVPENFKPMEAGDGGQPDACPSGQIWDKKKKSCVTPVPSTDGTALIALAVIVGLACWLFVPKTIVVGEVTSGGTTERNTPLKLSPILNRQISIHGAGGDGSVQGFALSNERSRQQKDLARVEIDLLRRRFVLPGNANVQVTGGVKTKTGQTQLKGQKIRVQLKSRDANADLIGTVDIQG